MPKGIYLRTSEMKTGKYKRTKYHCEIIGRNMKGKHHSEKTKRKLSEYNKGDKNYFWKGGKIRNAQGYNFVLSPNHPFKDSGGYVREHRLIMEKHLGRYLTPEEHIHHKNGIRNDNRIENLGLYISNRNWHPCLCPKCGFEFLIK